MFKKHLIAIRTSVILLLTINKKLKSLNQLLQDIRKSIKTISITINLVNSKSASILSNTIVILDLIAKLNLISQLHIKQLNLKTLKSSKFDIIILDKRKTQLYEIYILMFNTIDKLDHEQFFEEVFLAVDMKDDILLNML